MDLAYEVRPGENVPPPVRTQVLVTHDDAAVYFAFRAFDPRPAEIRAHLSDRDNLGADDWVAVILDTFNDERRSFDLLVNPLGVQADSIETASSNEEWDAIWEAAGRITDWGYAVEMRGAVLLAALPEHHVRATRPGGSTRCASYPRRVRHHIGLFPRDRNNNCYLCQAVKISGFEGVKPGRNLEVVPTLTGTRTDTRDALPDGPMRTGDVEADLGVTARWSATPHLTLQGTVNPDFSQVEADALQLDVNEPFALSFMEKRPFFMEGSDFFSTRLNAVYTRTVRDPAWGAKLSGEEQRHHARGLGGARRDHEPASAGNGVLVWHDARGRLHRRGAALQAGHRQPLHARRHGHGQAGRRLPQRCLRGRRRTSAFRTRTGSGSRCWARRRGTRRP
ncbi:MAG: DUF5916 domain-containing protein [Thermoanaerobaculaceae bacterium]